MKIAIGAILQETNTFSPVPGTLDHFRSVYYLRGDEISARLLDSTTEISGFYDVLAETGAQVTPTVAAMAVSGGRLTREAYETLRDDLLAGIIRAGRPDAVLLALHGAMCLEDDDDGDSRLLAELREIVGGDCPIVITHDLHANVTQRRTTLCDALIGYRTAPHVDHRETGARAARILLRMLKTGERPHNLLRKIPMIAASVRMNTAIDPLRAIIGRAREWEEALGASAVSVFWMQPWLDVAEAGAAVNVVCFGDEAAARAALTELGDAVWETRHDLDVELWSAVEAIREVRGQKGHPCVFADTGDPPPGGAPGDSNFLLDALLAEGADRFDRLSLLTLRDPEAARAMHAAGAGAELTLTLGGAIDRVHFTPRAYRGRVARLSDGRFTYQGPIAHGQEAQIGRAGVFEIGAIRVLVHELPAYSHDPAIFRAVGLAPEEAQIVVAKSPTQFRACYEPIAHRIYEIETPGICDVNLRRLDFRRLPRPIYPFDPEAEVERAFRANWLARISESRS